MKATMRVKKLPLWITGRNLLGAFNHVYLLIGHPSKISTSSLVNSLKGVSNRLIRRQHPDIADRYWILSGELCQLSYKKLYLEPVYSRTPH